MLTLAGQQQDALASAPNSAAPAIETSASPPPAQPNQTAGQPASDVELTALIWESATNGFGDVRLGKNAAGDACKLDGKTFTDCLGLHAGAELTYAINGFTRFTAVVGLDDDVNNPVACDVAGHYYQTASVRFQIYANATLIYDTGDLNKDDRTRPVDVNIPANANTLRIVVGDVDGKITCDMADIGGGHLWASGVADGTPVPLPTSTRSPTRTFTRTPSPTARATLKATSAATKSPTPTPVRTLTQTPAPNMSLGYRMYVPLVEVSEAGVEGLP